MSTKEILAELKKAGSDSVKKIFLKHGAKEPFYGVKVEDIKKISKKIKENKQQVALELFSSGIGDAQYMAGLMADGSLMSKKDLQSWVETAGWQMISEYSVAWVACENDKAWDLALTWIDSKKAEIASSGWSTLNCIMATWPDEKLDIPAIKQLLTRIEKTIDKSPNRVKYCMNGFVIGAGSYVKALTKQAMETGKKIAHIEVDMGDTSCKLPSVPDYINKVIDRGNWGKKKKTAKC